MFDFLIFIGGISFIVLGLLPLVYSYSGSNGVDYLMVFSGTVIVALIVRVWWVNYKTEKDWKETQRKTLDRKEKYEQLVLEYEEVINTMFDKTMKNYLPENYEKKNESEKEKIREAIFGGVKSRVNNFDEKLTQIINDGLLSSALDGELQTDLENYHKKTEQDKQKIKEKVMDNLIQDALQNNHHKRLEETHKILSENNEIIIKSFDNEIENFKKKEVKE